MSYSAKDFEFLGRQVIAGKYVTRTTCILSVVLALFLGLTAGYFMRANTNDGFTSGEVQRPLGEGQSSAFSGNMDKQRIASILEHEEEARKNPENVTNWEHLGNLYFDAGEPVKSIAAYEKALALQPNNVNVLVDCGVMYRATSDFTKALAYFDKALTLEPKHEIAHLNKGVVLYYDLDRKEDAIAVWKKLVAINPDVKAGANTYVRDMIKELEGK